MQRRGRVLVAGLGALLAGCSSGSAASTTTTPPHTTTTAAAHLGPDRQVWLCRPGAAPDPCTASLTATVVAGDGTRTVEHTSVAADPKIDCFYVYPTVSAEHTVNANLAVQPAETAVARAQASRFSSVCRVYAPIYRQVTIDGLFSSKTTAHSGELAYASALAAWRDYLERYNDGRGFVLIGHSQGSFVLEELIEHEIDDNPSLRRRLVSAILLGGNVLVPTGKDVGGEFHHIAACRSDSQLGCVIAYSSFDTTPPANSLFGRTSEAGDQVLCTNPAALAGGTGPLTPYFLTSDQGDAEVIASPTASTPWVSFPDAFTATCHDAGGASWLQIDPTSQVGAERAFLKESLGPTWGLHLYDANIALGDLVAIVHAEAVAYKGAS